MTYKCFGCKVLNCIVLEIVSKALHVVKEFPINLLCKQLLPVCHADQFFCELLCRFRCWDISTLMAFPSDSQILTAEVGTAAGRSRVKAAILEVEWDAMRKVMDRALQIHWYLLYICGSLLRIAVRLWIQILYLCRALTITLAEQTVQTETLS